VAKDILRLAAAPLLRVLPKGATMIATDVTGTFFVPLKVTLMAAFLLALPYVLWQAWAFVAPGLYQHEKRLALPVIVSSFVFFLIGCRSRISSCSRSRSASSPRTLGRRDDDDRHRQVSDLRADDVPRVRHHLRGAGGRDRARAHADGHAREAPFDPAVRDRGRVRRGRDFHSADVVSQLLLAVPLWLLYEFGMLMARFFVPPVADDAPAQSGASQ
jgi:sec-independent protein translocase protein TatC